MLSAAVKGGHDKFKERLANSGNASVMGLYTYSQVSGVTTWKAKRMVSHCSFDPVTRHTEHHTFHVIKRQWAKERCVVTAHSHSRSEPWPEVSTLKIHNLPQIGSVCASTGCQIVNGNKDLHSVRICFDDAKICSLMRLLTCTLGRFGCLFPILLLGTFILTKTKCFVNPSLNHLKLEFLKTFFFSQIYRCKTVNNHL